jgi:protein-tyrosine phosphatase
MKKYGIDISQLRARQITVKDFDIFDHIFVMDSTNYIDVIRICRNDKDKRKVELFLNLLEPGKNKNVSDPYYGGQQGFTDVYEVLNKASDKFIEIHVNGTKG